MDRRGFVMLVFILVLVGLLIAAGGVWYYKIYHPQLAKELPPRVNQSLNVKSNGSSTPADSSDNGLPVEYFSISNNAGYQYATKTLYQLAAEDESSGENNFCVIGYQSTDYQVAEIYWKQKDEIISWFPDVATSEDENDLLTDRIINLNQTTLDLKKDVVATEQEMNGSTYLVTQDWVDTVLNDCQKFGNQFLITWP
jgi:hypothetical protein